MSKSQLNALSLFFVAFVINHVTLESIDSNSKSERIFKGQVASIGQFPFMAAIFKGHHFQCSGVILNPHAILTAAHCVHHYRASIFSVATDEINAFKEGAKARISVRSYVVHYNYIDGNPANDFAIIKLYKPIKLGPNVKPIKLPREGEDTSKFKNFTAIGYGDNNHGSYKLKSIKVAKTECAYLVLPPTICTKAVTGQVCEGDSGGPLIPQGHEPQITIGVASQVEAGGKVVSETGCTMNTVAAYADVEKHLKWIKNNSK